MSDAPTKKCPACAELILAEAKKRKHCGEIIDLQMRDIEQLKAQIKQSGPVYMNAANGGAGGGLRYFNHGIHIVMTLLTAGLWLIIYIPLYICTSSATKIATCKPRDATRSTCVTIGAPVDSPMKHHG